MDAKDGLTLQTIAVWAWPVVLALGLGFWLSDRIDILEADVAARAPVAIVDETAAVRAATQNGAATLEDASKSVRQAVAELEAAGYIVLDRRYVLAAPAEFEARP